MLQLGCGERVGESGMTGEELFRLHCSSCHGDGSGNGHIAKTLKTVPRDLRKAAWQETATDSSIRRVIRSGGAAIKKSQEMPAFNEKLGRQDIELLVELVRAFAEQE